LAGDTSYFSNPQYQLWYTFGLLVGQAFAQVEVYIAVEGINLTDIVALITVLETVFGDPDSVVTAERKVETLKQTNCDFSTNYVEP
jgi:hypothetical protein